MCLKETEMDHSYRSWAFSWEIWWCCFFLYTELTQQVPVYVFIYKPLQILELSKHKCSRKKSLWNCWILLFQGFVFCILYHSSILYHVPCDSFPDLSPQFLCSAWTPSHTPISFAVQATACIVAVFELYIRQLVGWQAKPKGEREVQCRWVCLLTIHCRHILQKPLLVSNTFQIGQQVLRVQKLRERKLAQTDGCADSMCICSTSFKFCLEIIAKFRNSQQMRRKQI